MASNRLPFIRVFRDAVFHDLDAGHALANHVRRLAPPEKAASNRGLNLISFLGS